MRSRSFVVTVLAGISAVAVPAAAIEMVTPPRPRLTLQEAPPAPPTPPPAPTLAPTTAAPVPAATTLPAPKAKVEPAEGAGPAGDLPAPAAPEPATVIAPKPTVAPKPVPVVDKQLLRLACAAGRPDGVPKVRCEWSTTSAAVRYDLYRKTADVTPERVYSGPDTAFVDTAVAEGAGYGYGVKAIDAAGRVVGMGGFVGVRCCGEAAPTVDKQTLHLNCRVGLADGVPKVRWEWSAVAGAVRYDLYRKTADVTPERMYSGADTAFVDTAVAEGTGYGYGVKAIDAAGRVVGLGGLALVPCCTGAP